MRREVCLCDQRREVHLVSSDLFQAFRKGFRGQIDRLVRWCDSGYEFKVTGTDRQDDQLSGRHPALRGKIRVGYTPVDEGQRAVPSTLPEGHSAALMKPT